MEKTVAPKVNTGNSYPCTEIFSETAKVTHK
jgi:hypothetical protein